MNILLIKNFIWNFIINDDIDKKNLFNKNFLIVFIILITIFFNENYPFNTIIKNDKYGLIKTFSNLSKKIFPQILIK